MPEVADSAVQSRSVDISAQRVARVYAQAIIDAADKKNCRADVLEEL